MTNTLHSAAALRAFAAQLLQKGGLAADRAADVADILLAADLMGHDTHGLNLLPPYLEHLGNGTMAATGEPEVIAERPATLTWDGKQLPGQWLVLRAMDAAIPRARIHGTATVVIKNAHHIGSLSAYLQRATAQGFVMLLHSSAPGGSTVAPFGGSKGLFSPSPMSIGCPTEGLPILVDISTSITTNNMVVRLQKQGRKLPKPWLLDAQGQPSDDPAVIGAGGSLMPLGGEDAGHKGYGLALMVEALTAGLTDRGRHQPGFKFNNTVFLQLLDPEAFGGLPGLRSQMEHIAAACRDNPPRAGGQPVRLPGEAAQKRATQQEREGVALAPGVLDALKPWAERLGVALPAALG
ncbi:Ldh family oxidoreductase [Ramlibacter sp. G-1-2-2]|uniref:Ldh family oxidoreductase n=1 Tax=Ramlibacter agri TaxID=2728837 RepID=A0A848H5V7_9BURK|nr:Ldh family oxidoreductase [Ramlibacter agri]NML44660.1 Ldh family oxidoreductase [Ramlibacter agri]